MSSAPSLRPARPSLLLVAALLLASLGGGCGSGASQQELDAARRRNEQMEQELQASRDAASELEQQLAALQAANATLMERMGALGQSIAELQAREQQAQARLATFRELLDRFRALMQSGQLRVRIVRNRMVVELPEGILFASGRSALRQGGEQTLTQVAQILSEIPDREYQIAGHSDSEGTERPGGVRANWNLSAVRAVNVASFLVERGLPRERISAAGYGDTQPVASNDTPEGRAQNRRIEIVLLPNLNELPDLSSLEALGGE
ncbi:MAG: OmpA family protein [Myxococcales bacterium]|nr:OmpA family protein [Myxococcales bacterium]